MGLLQNYIMAEVVTNTLLLFDPLLNEQLSVS